MRGYDIQLLNPERNPKKRSFSQIRIFLGDSPTFFFNAKKNQYFAENVAKPHTQHENTSNNLAVCKVPRQENNKKYFSYKVKILPGREIITGESRKGEGEFKDTVKAYGNNCSNNPAAIIHLLLLLVLLSTEKKFSHRNRLRLRTKAIVFKWA